MEFMPTKFVSATLKRRLTFRLIVVKVAAVSVLGGALANAAWPPPKGLSVTRWARDVSADRAVLPEYPRPQLVREAWLNLNGLWDYAISSKEATTPGDYQGKILVPFPPQSVLSQVNKLIDDKHCIWYHRTLEIPAAWTGQRVLLNFGAVNWQTRVEVNGKVVGTHTGGYDGFTCDITGALRGSGPQDLVVRAWNPVEGGQPHGKQSLTPEGIFYTPTTGIWQTVWIEPVASSHIEELRMAPDVDRSQLRLAVNVGGAVAGEVVEAVALASGKPVARASGRPGETLVLSIPRAKLWWPAAPFLYDLKVTLRQSAAGSSTTLDAVDSYFGMRKISIGCDAKGLARIMLNDKPVFHNGFLDQGFWPEGVYTAPTDEALRFDLEALKKFGYNMDRKHIKVESDRWYYWADRLGVLVWQDMPAAVELSFPPNGRSIPDREGNFESELRRMIRGRFNHPSIVMWILFNEGWGLPLKDRKSDKEPIAASRVAKAREERMIKAAREEDPTRLIDPDSGAGGSGDDHGEDLFDFGYGDIVDYHCYGHQGPVAEKRRAAIVGEYGWGFAPVDALRARLEASKKADLSGCVVTQLTDVENEHNGALQYDRTGVRNVELDKDIPGGIRTVLRQHGYSEYPGGQPLTESLELSLADFGAQPDTGADASPALRKALSAAAKYPGPVTLRFPKGRYDLFPEKASHRTFFASNAGDTEGRHIIGVDLQGFKHLTLDGQGSLLMLRGNMTLLAADGCEDITVKNLTFDFLRPSMSEVKIAEVGRDYWIGHVHRDSKYQLVGGKRVCSVGENWKTEHSLVQAYDPTNNTTWRLNCDPINDGNSVEELRSGVLRFGNAKLPADLKVGHVLQCRMTRRDEVGMFINQSKDVSLYGVTVRYMHGFGILGQLSENLAFDHLAVAPDKASGRTCAAFADILHFSMCKGAIRVRDSVLTAAHDDAINVHGIHFQVMDKPAPNQVLVRFAHSQTWGFQAFFPGDEITFARKNTLQNFGDTKVAAVEVRNPREQLLTLADAVPKDVVLHEDCVENTTWTPSLEVRNCDVAAIPTRGFLITTRRPVLIENNRFFRIPQQSILIANDAANWFESGPVRDVTVRGNLFFHCGEAPIGVDNANHSGLRVENNQFVMDGYIALSASHVKGVTFRGNVLRTGNPPPNPRQLAFLDGCAGVVFENNTIEKRLPLSPPAAVGAAPGGRRQIRLDADWRFFKGDECDASQPDFSDAGWRHIGLPHDWSIEDLAPGVADNKNVLAVVPGTWRFKPGDDMAWKERDCNDSAWQEVKLPHHWSDIKQPPLSSFGWYRRKIDIPAGLRGKDIVLLLGKVDDADETFVNGVKVGSLGSMPPNYKSAWTASRRYAVRANLLKGDGTDVVAVRDYNGDGDAGIYAAAAPAACSGPFDPDSNDGEAQGYTVGGVGWYRKTFELPDALRGCRVNILFDGVYMNSQVWLNGKPLGRHPYGYTSFGFDLTPHVRFDRPNVLAVKVDASGRTSRWYSGAGIYRHVWLTISDPVHVAQPWGVYFATLQADSQRATVRVRTTLINESGKPQTVTLTARLVDARGAAVAAESVSRDIPASGNLEVGQQLQVAQPALWSPDAPNLYRLVSTVTAGGRKVDEVATSVGIRTISVDAQRGFLLNGQPMKLRGGCVHHDNGCLGACAYDRAEERRVALLKAAGFNAIRTSHNPPSPAFLDACDRLGVLVLDEAFDCWKHGKNGNDYGRYFDEWWQRDVDSMVLRDRNHPSVALWSIGNEVPGQSTAEGGRTGAKLAARVRMLDSTRPVTQAANPDDTTRMPIYANLDVCGYNYMCGNYVRDHGLFPSRVMAGTESQPMGCFDQWMAVLDHPYVIGDFVWTAFDYLGEAGIGGVEPRCGYADNRLWTVSSCGDLDLCGFKRPPCYYREAVWGCAGAIACFAEALGPDGKPANLHGWSWPDERSSWTWPGREGKPVKVHAYASAAEVRLLLNGKDLGVKPTGRDNHFSAEWSVLYAPGELVAVGLNRQHKEISRSTLRTAAAPAALRLTPDRTQLAADGQDISFVTVEVLDARGVLNPNAAPLVRFALEGPGTIVGVGNGDPRSMESFQQPQRLAYRGRCLAVIKAGDRGGSVRLKAVADGLRGDEAVLQVNAQ